MLKYLEWIAFGLSLVGVIFNIRKNRICFALWFIACWIWIYLMGAQNNWGMVATQVIFVGTNIWGWCAWSPRVDPHWREKGKVW